MQIGGLPMAPGSVRGRISEIGGGVPSFGGRRFVGAETFGFKLGCDKAQPSEIE